MRIQQFLEHHGIARNPFAEEDAQTDPVFKDHCIETTYHPAWDKVYGDPADPATAIVFGEKGSGKTALRLQLAKHLLHFNDQNPGHQNFIIHYDDFNPFLDRFRDRLGPRKQRADRVLAEWKLWDHMDCILPIGVTGLIDRILEVHHPSPAVEMTLASAAVDRLDRHQARDLLLLAACYDQSTAETFRGRWHRLRRRLRFGTLQTRWPLILGVTWTVLAPVLLITLLATGFAEWLKPLWLYLLLCLVGWIPWLVRVWKMHWLAHRVTRRMRVSNRDAGDLRSALMHLRTSELASQPLPSKDRTDDRYELLGKFQAVLDSLGFEGIVVLVDRVDEPHIINGSAELMKALLWPMLDNKFLKQPSVGLKLMLPVELTRFVDREDREFYRAQRLDKQNMIRSFEWTGEALLDVTNARLAACAEAGQSPALRDLFSAAITNERLLNAFRGLRTPRHLFKFMYALLVAHCNAYTDQQPVYEISSELFESTLAVYTREQDAYDRGVGAG